MVQDINGKLGIGKGFQLYKMFICQLSYNYKTIFLFKTNNNKNARIHRKSLEQ